MNTEQVKYFEEGFMKGFEESGFNKLAAAGFVSMLDDISGEYNKLAMRGQDYTGDINFRKKLAEEILIHKTAELPSWLYDFINNEAGKQSGGGNEMLGGGAGGGLLGLLAGQAFDNPMMGMLLGGGGGALLGHYLPHIAKYMQGMDFMKGHMPAMKAPGIPTPPQVAGNQPAAPTPPGQSVPPAPVAPQANMTPSPSMRHGQLTAQQNDLVQNRAGNAYGELGGHLMHDNPVTNTVNGAKMVGGQMLNDTKDAIGMAGKAMAPAMNNIAGMIKDPMNLGVR